jgi:hypothetical protein
LAQAILNNKHEKKSSKSPEDLGQENEVNQIISIIENEEYNKSCINITPIEDHNFHDDAAQL